ncbi:hypothetical protein [Marinifilum caeruleilacunae]|uniref:Uncharacterized protein n=1 Tax=Marinifilum caeruleilacunae TaxID=2499076 RepID=A0ABX1X105_9BACT|nr:hypothetical protein [Marinifilum caeruleilacunae]NOU61989.1 hypothetical protein [Marinifilum caeruleilacunae]
MEIQNKGQISVFPIDLNKIARLEEYEDEGDLYLIETKDKKCIYLWDNEYYLIDDKDFPSDKLEVYIENAFKYGIGKKVNCLGNKVTPIIVKGDYKWSYFGKLGFPDDLQIEDKQFDAIIEEINNESLTMAHKA